MLTKFRDQGLGLMLAASLMALGCTKAEPVPPPSNELSAADLKRVEEIKQKMQAVREGRMTITGQPTEPAAPAAGDTAAAPAGDAAPATEAPSQEAPAATNETAAAPAEPAPSGPRPSVLIEAMMQPLTASLQHTLEGLMSAGSALTPQTPAAAAEKPAEGTTDATAPAEDAAAPPADESSQPAADAPPS